MTSIVEGLEVNPTEDLIAQYLQLDPTGSYFKNNSIAWSNKLDEAVSLVDICNLTFEKLLGTRSSVPTVDETFFPLGDMVDPFHAAISTGANFAITGHAGTGKSMFVEQMAARCNRPFFVADLHEDYRAETLFGEYKPADGGKLEWKDGPISEALKAKGSFVLLDEANMSQPAVLACAHRVLAGGNIFLHDKGGRAEEVSVRKMRGVTFTMACNALNNANESVMYNDTKQMNRAFLDRWGVVCQADYPNKVTEVAILIRKLEAFFPDTISDLMAKGLKQKVEQVVKVANKIRTQIDSGHLNVAFSLRRTEILCKLMAHYKGEISTPIHLGVINREDFETGKALDDLFFSEFGESYKRKFQAGKF